MNNPKVKLLSITNDIQNVMGSVWEVAKGKVPLDQIDTSKVDIDSILSTDLPTSEFINTIWCIEGMPRAWWDQCDRHRHAAFWQQSVRILDLTTFADKKEYWIPESIANSPVILNMYEEYMRDCQDTYAAMVRMGIPSEDARGVLPLHINVRGTMCINLRALKGMLASRTCWISQGSMWQPIVIGMVLELRKHLSSKVLKSLVHLPCYKKSSCPIEGNVVTRLTDEDPNPCCPIYLKRFAKDKEEAKKFTLKRHPNYKKLEEEYFNFIRTLGLEE